MKGECHLFAPQEREVLYYLLVEEKSFIYFLKWKCYIVVFIETSKKECYLYKYLGRSVISISKENG